MMNTPGNFEVSNVFDFNSCQQQFVINRTVSFQEGLQWKLIHLSILDTETIQFHSLQMNGPVFK
jgi:hypothetical protein